LGTWYWGYVLGVLNTALDTIHVIYDIKGDDSQIIDGFLTASVAMGGFLGSWSASVFFSTMSRRKALIIFDFIGIFACLITVLPNLVILLIGRFLTGVVAGLNTTLVTAYV
jgi:predicted MFS family arabinose efflux permease